MLLLKLLLSFIQIWATTAAKLSSNTVECDAKGPTPKNGYPVARTILLILDLPELEVASQQTRRVDAGGSIGLIDDTLGATALQYNVGANPSYYCMHRRLPIHDKERP